jgi:hypothetical protein
MGTDIYMDNGMDIGIKHGHGHRARTSISGIDMGMGVDLKKTVGLVKKHIYKISPPSGKKGRS